jgi:branched-chain amino acid aminotransferase
MPAMAWIDGALVPLDEARVPITDRGFLWGDHVFEIIRAEARVLLDGEAHLARLARSAALVRMAPPDVAAVARAIAAALAAAGEGASSVRVMWTRGSARGLALSAATQSRLIVTVEPTALLAGASEGAGVTLAVVRGSRAGLVPFEAKTGNYLGSVLALAAANEAGADDALFVDGDDNALETATANLFVVERKRVTTPAGALLPGVTAARVMQLLEAAGHAVLTGPLSLERVRGADELFVTSARRGPVPVVALDGEARTVGPLTRVAASAYAAWALGYTLG